MSILRVVSLVLVVAATGDCAQPAARSLDEQLGESIFFDSDLSINNNVSCATCHGPEVGWTSPDAALNVGGAVYEGSIAGRFGNRKPPSSAYATQSPVLHLVIDEDKQGPRFIGGAFWDGRATGEKLGSPAADQAQGPFLNPLEQALPDSACVVYRVCMAAYPVSLDDVYPDSCAIAFPDDTAARCAAGETVALAAVDRAGVDAAYDAIALAIAAFEGSLKSNVYTSKYDSYLAGEVELSKLEEQGLALFEDEAKCANCHVLDAGPKGEPPLLTDFSFDNLGAPRNPQNPFYEQKMANPAGYAWVDEGLGGFLNTRQDYATYAAETYGRHKVPTLRNVDKRPNAGFVKAYMHNGYFKSLWQVVHFYNTRDAKPVCADDPATAQVDESMFTPVEAALAKGCWPAAEVPANVNAVEIGDLHLSTDQENAIVAFLATLSDGYSSP